ncbi:hypothetical protein [Nocardioides daejeonensis]|uniref:hypothetical protein n=1 Tax=Nocardioides daejeonensis TaxID=1046556 RepID=UPI000D741004|nr:hypothetical protein [Nocardioides daejeonensis]
MSDEQSRPDGVDAPAPPPATQEPQLLPGGADSLDDPKYGDTPGDPVPRDLDPDDNPAVDDEAPEEVKEPDDKDQEPSQGVSGEDDLPDEPPA